MYKKMLTQLFRVYEELAAKADFAFNKIEQDYGSMMKCRRRCADCCHAVFGLFLIEAVFINHHFNTLGEDEQKEILKRAAQADRELRQMKEKLAEFKDDPQMQVNAMARERIRCPLLDDKDECVLYPFRPITCRVYGIPVSSHGSAHACWKAEFKRGESYPTFNLDAAYAQLFRLSQELLENAGQKDSERASILLSVSSALSVSHEDLITGNYL
jgi:Fe-S-cluster containining protein